MTPPVEPLLVASGLHKSYGPVRVLTDVDFDLRRGEVHALVGENGAGKSTLSRILAGLTPPDAGTLRLQGRPYQPRDRRDAERHGVRMVLQELNLIPNLTVAESLFLDCLPHRWGWIDRTALACRARAALARVGLDDFDPGRLVRSLGIGRQQMVEIAAGLARHCDVLILDEPTAALAGAEIERLFAQVAALKAAGAGIIYISHRLEEIRRIADRVSVLRDGRLVATRPASDCTIPDLVRLMVGRDLDPASVRRAHPPGPVALEVRGLRCPPGVREVSLSVRRGEILGLAGLMGSGRTETLRAIYGADPAAAGEIRLYGGAPVRFRSPRDAVRHGLALITEDRKTQGLLLPLTVRVNLTLPTLRAVAGTTGWIRRAAEAELARQWVRRLFIRCRSEEQPVAELSGGNQQKVVLARWLCRDCDILLFDEPTRGIDVGARFEIYRWLDELAALGKALVVVSSDLPELMMLCDRIAVLSTGRLVATFARGEWSEDRLLSAALSGHLATRN